MNKNFSYNELYKKIASKTNLIVKESKTGVALFSEFGARLLGLFPSTEQFNTLWVPEDIDSRISANDWLLGGERLWVAPQRDYFFTDPQNFSGFHVPPPLDPGHYALKNNLSFENNFSLHNYTQNEEFCNCIAKRDFSIIDIDPYKSNLNYIGVKINDLISIPNTNTPVCAWSIAMVPTIGPQKPGTVLLPIANKYAIATYFDSIPSERSFVENDFARFLIDSKSALKLAVIPDGIVWNNPAKILYLAPFVNNTGWYCLVKRSDDLPKNQEECVDIPANNTSGLKGAVQAYNHGYGSEMLYGEIELQFTKGTLVGDRIVSGGAHELLSYCGSKEEILNLAKQIIGTESTPEIY